MKKFLIGAIKTIYVVFITGIVFLLLGYQDHFQVYTEKSFPVQNGGLLYIAVFLLFSLIYILFKHRSRKLHSFYFSKILFPATLVLFTGFQLFFTYSAFFKAGWDSEILVDTAYHLLYDEYQQVFGWYFSKYPNNLFIVWFYSNLWKAFSLFLNYRSPFLLAAMQCLLNSCSVCLIYVIIRLLTRSTTAAWAAYLSGWLLVGFSPWTIVIYSDATGIIFPVLILALYQLQTRSKKLVRFLIFAAIGVFSFTGGDIKPQILIIFIAICITEMLHIFNKTDPHRVRTCFWRIVTMSACGVLTACIIQSVLVPTMNIELHPEDRFGATHMLMLGLNTRTDGVHAEEDVRYSASFSTVEKRRAGEIKEIYSRIKGMGPSGLLRHLCRKAVVTYGDGTFAWAEEGNFFSEVPEWAKNAPFSNFFRSWIYPDGKYYNIFLIIKQLLWITILFCIPLCFIGPSDKRNLPDTMLVIMLSIIGLTIFELLFEARARYLYCYSPLYIIAAMYSIHTLAVRYARCLVVRTVTD